MKRHLATLFVLALAVPVLTGCSKEPVTSPAVNSSAGAPALPPAESMNFDLSFFDSGAALATSTEAGSEETASKSNWINAVVRVIYINLTVADIFAPPVHAIQAATSTKPVLGEDGWFVWTYVWKESEGHDVTIRLRGRINGAIVTWEMRVDDPLAGLDDFLWFSGEQMLASHSGYWSFNDLRDGQAVPVARIDWSNPDKGKRSLSFTNIDLASAELNDSLTYCVEGDIVAVTFHDDSEQLDADITWNEATGAGSLMVPDYNNGERACWDEMQENTACEPAV